MISVALCTYNGESYIQEQLESIIQQSVKVDEIVIRDDGSTDNTLGIVYSIANEHPELLFKVEQNQTQFGVVKNFEEAILSCQGDIVLLSDQDDVWNTNKVETIVSWFENNPSKDTVFTNASLINAEGNLYTENDLFDMVGFGLEIQKMFELGLSYVIFQSPHATGATMAFRKCSFSPVLGYCDSLQFYHDEVIALLALNRNALGFINEPLIRYRIHSKQKVGLGGGGLAKQLVDGYFHTIPMAQLGNLKKMTTLPINASFKETLSFLINRAKKTECIDGVLFYVFCWIIGKYRRCFYSYGGAIAQHDITFWLSLRARRLQTKLSKMINYKQ